MNSDHLSSRLKTVAGYVKKNSRLADIGSDHAYLPIWLAKNNIINFGIAGEVVRGPYENAKNEISKAGLNNTILPRLADGLAAIEASDHIDTITIAGMGGTLISQILDSGVDKLKNVQNLILQPNVGEKILREWLMHNGYKIFDEQILAEDRHTYEVIVAEPVNDKITYSDKELTFGPFLVNNPNEVFYQKWRSEKQQLENVLKQIETSKKPNIDKIDELNHQIKQINEVIGNES